MRTCTQLVAGVLVGALFSFGCSSGPPAPGGLPGSGGGLPGTGGGGGLPGTGGTGGAGTCGAHSEGSSSAPIVMPLVSTPMPLAEHASEGPSYYHITGLQAHARYKFDPVPTDGKGAPPNVAIFQSGFAGKPACQGDFSAGGYCMVVVQHDSVDVELAPTINLSVNQCYSLTVTLDSPAGAFEGAPDSLVTLRYGTPDLPHRGIVDHDSSYYLITQLTKGKRYVAWVTGTSLSPIELAVGPQDPDPEVGVTNLPCLAGNETPNGLGKASCMFDATSDSTGLAIHGVNGAAKYVISVFEDVPSEGTAANPVVLPYSGGIDHVGRVAATPGKKDESDYEITGLTQGQDYLVSLSDPWALQSYVCQDAQCSAGPTCTNFSQASACRFTAPSSSVFVRVSGGNMAGLTSRSFNLHAHAAPVDEGSLSAPKALSYPGSVPYSGQVSTYSYYALNGLPQGPVELTMTDADGPLLLSAWPKGGSTVQYSMGTIPHLAAAANSSGGLIVRAEGIGHFQLGVVQAPALTSDYVHDAGNALIPATDPNGLTDTLTVSGSPITSISSVKVELYIVDNAGPVSAYLLAPDGKTRVTLIKNGGKDYEGVFFSDYALDDLSGNVAAPFDSFRPKQPLYAFEGMNANGTWTLQVVNGTGYKDRLLGWGLSFQ